MLFRCPHCGAAGAGFVELSKASAGTGPGDEQPAATLQTAGLEPPPGVGVPVSAESPRPSAVHSQASLLAWQFQAPWASGPQIPARGCPAVDPKGHIFVCCGSELLHFLPGSRFPSWNYKTAAPLLSSPVFGDDDCVRVHSADGRLHVVDLEGRPVFEPVDAGRPLNWATPLVDADNNTWICRYDGGLTKVDSAGGSGDQPYFRTRRRFDCTGLIHRNTLYVGCEDHFVYAVPLGEARGQNAWVDWLGRGRTGGAVHCPLALGPGPEIIAASQDDHLYGFGPDGRQHWRMPLPGSGHTLASPVVGEDGTIYVAVSRKPPLDRPQGRLCALDRSTQQIKWQYQADAPVESTPVIGDDGILYFGDNHGSIHAVDCAGRLVWKTVFDAPVRSAGALIQEGLVAFTLDSGRLVVLRCSSRALPQRGWPKLLGNAVQAATGP
jgi:outer membrane protein assembly factor BamB